MDGYPHRKAPLSRAGLDVRMCHLCDATEGAFSQVFPWRPGAKLKIPRRGPRGGPAGLLGNCGRCGAESRSACHHALASSGTTGQKMAWQKAGSSEQRRFRRQRLIGQRLGKTNRVLTGDDSSRAMRSNSVEASGGDDLVVIGHVLRDVLHRGELLRSRGEMSSELWVRTARRKAEGMERQQARPP